MKKPLQKKNIETFPKSQNRTELKNMKNTPKKILQQIWFFFAEKNATILSLLCKEISLQPELSSQPHFKIQGG